MVVKELRQGLRTRLFGGVMLALHALLVLITLMTASSTGGQARGLMDGLVSFTLCLIFPLCGFSALAGEMQANTMDMLVLTRLSTWRIVFGKWAAIIVQSLLVTISVVPYLVARYVFGGSELGADLVSLFQQWMISIVLTAAVVALSTQKHFWLRALILGLPLVITVFGSFAQIIIGIMGRATFSSGVQPQFLGYVSAVAVTAWLVFALLSFGASRIAPASSMLPVRKRLVNLAALIVLSGLAWWVDPVGLVGVMMMVLVVASLDAMTDDVNNIPSLYLPFYQRGFVGRLVSWFLAPGWMHGFLYSLLLFGVCSGLLLWLRGGGDAARLWLLGGCLWQMALFGHILAIQRRGEYLGAFFAGLCIQLLLTFLTVLVVNVSKFKTDLEWVACVMPWNAFGAPSKPFVGQWSYFQVGVMLSTLWPIFLTLPALLAFLRTRTARRQARQFALSSHE